MPRGSYLLSDHQGPFARERFACAPGPLGGRYAATREDPTTGAPLGGLDVVLDPRGRVLRLQVTGAGWELRGGAVGEDQVLWKRGAVERQAAAAGFSGTSPVFALAAIRRLRPDSRGVTARLAMIGDAALSVLLVDHRWTATAPGPGGAASYEVADLSTGVRGAVLIERDVVLAAPGAVLLEVIDTTAARLGPQDWQL